MKTRFTRPSKEHGLEVAFGYTGHRTVIIYRSVNRKGAGSITVVPSTSVIVLSGALEMVEEIFRPRSSGGVYRNQDLRDLKFIPENTSDTVVAHVRRFFSMQGKGGRREDI